ncbi:NAD-dependent epimerase/dehydratase family protein [Salinibacter grassmerensis]|uniref:NAD-dependent epimerase/dehydratase family protein n=1 Tax=Salinibacter grassmerensis TaxID=3040353 RepID=UPI0021E8ACE2|nr:NAD-dependent epimerase/dehydratase family protein [Salinibacter grassmerensis]
MTYLITGGAGFIGSHLADRLIENGHRVRVLDDLSTGRRENIAHLEGRDEFTLTTGSVLDEDVLDREIGAADRVVHLAAAVGVKRILDRPVETIHTNVDGTKNVLQRAAEEDKKVLAASTSEVYGKAMQENEDLEALSETDNWTLGATGKRRWAYACTKAMDEFLAQAYHDEYGLPVTCVRFFNTAGPRQSGQYGMVIPTFVERALSGQPLDIHGDGTQTRCFTHIDDAVRAVVQLLDTPAAEGEVVNVGQPTEISINDLAERVLALTGSNADVRHVPYEEVYGDGFEDMKRRTPDCSKLADLTGYEPQRTVDDILRDVIEEVGAAKDEEAGAVA